MYETPTILLQCRIDRKINRMLQV